MTALRAKRTTETGAVVSLYDGEAAGMDTDGGRWQVVCEDHGTILSLETLAEARRELRLVDVTLGFCDECRERADAPAAVVEEHWTPAHYRVSTTRPDGTTRMYRVIAETLEAAEAYVDAIEPESVVRRDDTKIVTAYLEHYHRVTS